MKAFQVGQRICTFFDGHPRYGEITEILGTWIHVVFEDEMTMVYRRELYT